ncbi:hypothetical protein [Streptomyces sp. NPDC051994]|uniref:hypothetical protein n=1 Tax=unclassified Streptomyces TaxID=2593676 RepID=UPI0034406F4A
MGITSRAGLASVMACMATAAAVAPAVAAPTVPVTVPLYGLNAVLPFDAPTLDSGVPLPIPGAPKGPRYVKGNLLPKNMVPTIPVDSALPATEIGAPLPNPLSPDLIGTARLASPSSPLHATTPGAEIGAPISRPRSPGLPSLVMPEAGLAAPALQGDPAAIASL